jgi:hypothetical protein
MRLLWFLTQYQYHYQDGNLIGLLCRVIWKKFTDVSGNLAVIITREITSETSANLYQTIWLNNPEDSRLKTRRRENMNSHITTK